MLGEIAQLDEESITLDGPAGGLAAAAPGAGQRAGGTRARLGGVRGRARGGDGGPRRSGALGRAVRREELERSNEEDHRLEVELTEAGGMRRGIMERVETEWKQPLEQLLATAPAARPGPRDPGDRSGPDRASRSRPSDRSTRWRWKSTPRRPSGSSSCSSQRDDLVAARQSLLQAIREIDGTARLMFQETFLAVQEHFRHVFQTLFGGGECELRLADPDDPLESEIDIHAAPRGKRTQRIHLLSSGERTLVAVSLLFSIYLTKPSPFCLMDEVDAPLDDANVGRFTTLLDEFKKDTQFLVITHNPRTMQSADAVYGVTMQEPGVSTIVGVRLSERQGVGTGH